MIALIQRVSSAAVEVDHRTVAQIQQGLLVFVGIAVEDHAKNVERLAQRIVGYRVFGDDQDKMNLNVAQISGSVLLVPQFTLVADTTKGMRPSFSRALAPDKAQPLFDQLARQISKAVPVAVGVFGAQMAVSLTNDGPVTFWLET